MKTKVFISYARPDQDFVEQLARDLSEADAGLDILYDAIQAVGSDWRAELRDLVANCDFLATVISTNIYQADGQELREWISIEANWAEILEVVPRPRRPFQSFLIRKDEVKIPDEFRTKNYIDFRRPTHALQKMRYYLTSEATLRKLFFDREKHIRDCFRIFQEQQLPHLYIIYNYNGEQQLGSSYLLGGLKVALIDEWHDNLPDWPEPYPVVMLFHQEQMQHRLAWLTVLNETVEEIAVPDLFPEYLAMREYCENKASEWVNPPLFIQSDNPDRLRGIHINQQRTHALNAWQSHRSGNLQNALDNFYAAEMLTKALFNDLSRASVQVVWLLDWPDTNPLGSVTHRWLCELVMPHIRARTVDHLWVIVSGREPILPTGELQNIPNSCLEPFDVDAIEEYVKRRNVSKAPEFWRLMAQYIHDLTDGRPNKIHDAYDSIMDKMRWK